MRKKSKRPAHTLTEMTVVIATVALLATFGLPAIRAFLNTFEFQGGAKAMISAGLASARAIAAKEQRYAGIRFQNKYEQDNKGCQYMVFIIQDPKIGAYFFRAVEGLEPIKLPDSIGVMDLMVRINHGTHWRDAEDTSDEAVKLDYLDDTVYITDTSSFSIVFSPSGKLIIHDLRVRNSDGIYNPDNDNPLKVSMDDIFNSGNNITNYSIGMFVQDDYAYLGLGAESSRNRFVIYDKTLFDRMNRVERFNYLDDLEVIYINPYTGTMIQR